jgi:hypothetical protein
MQGYTTTQQTNVHCSPPYCTGTKSYVTRRVSRPPSIATDSSKDIEHTLHLLEQIIPLEDCHTAVAFLPFIQNTFYHISRVLSTHNIKMLGFPPSRISKLLQPLKDDLGLKSPGIQRIPFEYRKCIVDKPLDPSRPRPRAPPTYQPILTRKLVMAEHNTDLSNWISSVTMVSWP